MDGVLVHQQHEVVEAHERVRLTSHRQDDQEQREDAQQAQQRPGFGGRRRPGRGSSVEGAAGFP